MRTATPQEMLSLVQQHPNDHVHVVDLPYRLASWAFDYPGNSYAWRDASGELLAWAVLQTPFWTVDLACRPDLEPSLFPEILAWVDSAARLLVDTPSGRPACYANVFPHQERRRAALETAGWACQSEVGEDSWEEVLLVCDLKSKKGMATGVPPPGYSLRPLAGAAEVGAYVDLHQAVFESKNMTLPWRETTLQQPDYRPELDLVIDAPGGGLAAFCIGWLSPDRLTGQIEPLGVAREYRRLNLGRLLLEECLRRMHALGAEQVLVLTDNFRGPALSLYQSAGFQVREPVLVYRKDFTG